MTRRRTLVLLLCGIVLTTPGRIAAQDGAAPPEPAAARPAAADLVRDADALFAREEYAAARALYERALAEGAGGVHVLRRLALLQSWDGDLRDAIAHYRRAREQAPDDLDLALDLARTLTWKNELSEAIRLCRDLRAAHPDDPRVLLALAQALAWKGRYDEAEAIYARMVEAGIDPVRAHLGRAQVLAWRGDLDRAVDYYRDVLKADPGNVEARLGLARAHHWQGLNRAARAQADNILLDHPENPEARRLQRTIHDALRPSAALEAFRFSDSDSNRVDAAVADYTFMAEPQTSVRVAYGEYRAGFRCQDASFCDEPGLAVGDEIETDARTLQAGIHSRVIAPIHFHARLGAVRQDSFGGGTRTLAVGGGFIRWQVGPRFATVGTGAREALLDTAPLIDRGIRVDSADLRLEFRFRPAWMLAGSAGYALYSDDNARRSAGVTLSWRLPVTRLAVEASIDGRYRSFTDDTDSGYFDPLRYDSELLTVAVSDTHGETFFWRVEGTVGRQDFETGAGPLAPQGSDDTVQAVSAALGAHLSSRATLEAFYSDSDYAQQLAAGFKASRSGFTFRYRF